MPIDPQDGGPDDWFVPTSDGYPDDWFVPESDGYPNDWFVPASAAPGAAQPAHDPQLGTADPTLATRPAPRPDPIAAYWASIPASRAGAMAWHPPIFLNSPGQYPLSAPAPIDAPWRGPRHGLLAALTNPPGQSAPSYGPFGGPTNPPSANRADFPSFQPIGSSLGNGDQPSLPPLFSSLANLPWSSTTTLPDAAGDTAGQTPFLDGAPFGARPSDWAPGITAAMLNSQTTNPSAAPFPQTITSGNSDLAAQQSPLPDVSGVDLSAPPAQSSDAADNSAGGPSSAFNTDSTDSSSITRVVRDSTGRALAIIHVRQDPLVAPPPGSVNDATPDTLRPGAKYAQVNNAVTGHPVIDRTTDMLLAALQRSIEDMGSGSGPLFGIRVHIDFSNRVKRLDLPGIGQDGVEQSFHLNAVDFVRYGLDGSVRTDIALRDPRNPS